MDLINDTSVGAHFIDIIRSVFFLLNLSFLVTNNCHMDK